MAFLDKNDLIEGIDENILDDITQFDDNKLVKAITWAVDQVKGYLKARYDIDAIFAATGDDRSEVVLECCKDFAIWRLHKLINPRKIPKFRKENYETSKEDLQDVQALLINWDLPVPVTDDKNYFKGGGLPKRENYI
jgi:hypothetical protein